MKCSNLKAVGHKIADSLAPGIGLMIGTYEMNVFAEASAASPGFIEADFIRGHTAGTPASESLRAVSALYSHKGLPNLCAKHSVNLSQVNVISARFGVDSAFGPHFTSLERMRVANVQSNNITAFLAGVCGGANGSIARLNFRLHFGLASSHCMCGAIGRETEDLS